jgi:hypothetical protein
MSAETLRMMALPALQRWVGLSSKLPSGMPVMIGRMPFESQIPYQGH